MRDAVLRYRDVSQFLELSDEERRSIFKAPAAEVARIVSVHVHLIVYAYDQLVNAFDTRSSVA